EQIRILELDPKIYEQDAKLKANRLLKENWDAYLRLVEAMKNRESVDDCRIAIVGESAAV
ncbi:MAG: hypothetical protein AAGB01_06050, partial [Cyanobacteria bacterium P01_F01_bin.42]